jgi:hypothetical protein
MCLLQTVYRVQISGCFRPNSANQVCRKPRFSFRITRKSEWERWGKDDEIEQQTILGLNLIILFLNYMSADLEKRVILM